MVKSITDTKLNPSPMFERVVPPSNDDRMMLKDVYLNNLVNKSIPGSFFEASLQETSSQKHSFPRRLLSDMQTWSTMNILILISDVQVRCILYCARKVRENIILHMLY